MTDHRHKTLKKVFQNSNNRMLEMLKVCNRQLDYDFYIEYIFPKVSLSMKNIFIKNNYVLKIYIQSVMTVYTLLITYDKL